MPASEIWTGLVKGRIYLRDSWCSETEASLVLEQGEEGGSFCAPWTEILQRVLRGESQKSVAFRLGTSVPTIATRCAQTLRAVGFTQSTSRCPLALMLAAHAASGVAMPAARSRVLAAFPRNFLAVSLVRPDLSAPRSLTIVERDVLRLFVEGHTYDEIATLRDRSVRTIANQLGAVRGSVRAPSSTASRIRP